MDALEKSADTGRIEQFQKSPTGQGLEAYKEAKDFIKAETGCDSISKGLNHLDSLSAQKQEVWKGIVEKYDTAVKKLNLRLRKNLIRLPVRLCLRKWISVGATEKWICILIKNWIFTSTRGMIR